jgi:hypothetical protein
MSRIHANRSLTSMVSAGGVFRFEVLAIASSLLEQPCRAAAPALPRPECISNGVVNNHHIGDTNRHIGDDKARARALNEVFDSCGWCASGLPVTWGDAV